MRWVVRYGPLSPTLVEYTYNAMDELQSSRSDKGAPRAFFYHEGVLVNQRQGLQIKVIFSTARRR